MIYVLWFVLAIVIGVMAGKRGRTGIGWFFLAVLISPLIAGVILLLVGDYKPELEAQQLKSGAMKRCPFCAEMIKSEAMLCRHCGSTIPTPKDPDEFDRSDPAQVMARFGITVADGRYTWRAWTYDKLEDAAAYAEKTLADERAKYG